MPPVWTFPCKKEMGLILSYLAWIKLFLQEEREGGGRNLSTVLTGKSCDLETLFITCLFSVCKIYSLVSMWFWNFQEIERSTSVLHCWILEICAKSIVILKGCRCTTAEMVSFLTTIIVCLLLLLFLIVRI